MNDVVVDPVLGVREAGHAEQPPGVGLVLTEQGGRGGPAGPGGGQQLQAAQEGMIDGHRAVGPAPQPGPGRVRLPGPGVAEPGGREHLQGGRLGAGVGHPDHHEQVGGVGLGIIDLHDPVPVLVEHAGVDQPVLRVEPAPPPVPGEQVGRGEGGLGVVVAPAVPGVAGDGVQVPPVLLDVLAVVGLGPGQAEHPLLEDRVAAVPQHQAQTQPLLHIAEAGHGVLAPPVGARPGMIVREVGQASPSAL
jgi:hypothetical protein